MKNDKQFLMRAIELAREHSAGGINGPFGAVVVKNSEIAGEGWNRVVETNDPTAHAEVTAIRNACRNLGTFSLEGCTLYSSCEPCPMCMSAIYWARIERLVYGATKADAAAVGFDDARILDEIRLPDAEKSIVVDSLAGDEARVVFEEWTRNQKRVMY
jgi:guanine deaminase